MKITVAVSAVALAMAGLVQSGAQSKHVEIPNIAPRPEDVASIDGMIKAWYEIVSVPKGQMPDWGRDHSLYIADVRFVEMHERAGTPSATIVSHQQYADASASIAEEGFSEKEIHRVTERFANMAHVWSTYESRRTPEGPVMARGINSIELFWDGKRWWIANAVWENETRANPIPKEFLP
jgi:hypothetical protein